LGVEGFSSYESSVFIKLIEKVGKWIAYELIILRLSPLWKKGKSKTGTSL